MQQTKKQQNVKILGKISDYVHISELSAISSEL
jgi:hypothetical protein